MVLEESIQFIILFAITVFFSGFAFTLKDSRYVFIFKLLGVLCWFVLGVSEFIFFGVNQFLAAPLMLLFIGFGLVFAVSMVDDYQKLAHEKIWDFKD